MMNDNVKFFDERKKYVSDFMKAYLLTKKLQDASVDDNENQETTVPLCKTHPFDTHLEAGQVRVLRHTQRVTYVVLLKRWEDDSFVVTPFSFYSVPATDEELKTVWDGGLFLRVLQVWNTRTLQDETLYKSWLVGYLPAQDVKDAWRCWEASLGGEPLSDSILKRTALPIIHSNDPRLEYKRQELTNFARVDAEDLETLEKPRIWTIQSFFNRQNALAAASAEDNPQFIYSIEEKNLIIFIEYSLHDKVLSCEVSTKDGKPRTELDGCQVMEVKGQNVLGVIKDGQMKVECEYSDNLAICFTDADGNDLQGYFQVNDND